MISRCLISFGANLGNAQHTIESAASFLESKLAGSLQAFQLSRLCRTPPVGGPTGQPPFINAVAAIETSRSVWEVWDLVRETENHFGRNRNRRWEARKLDLDILLFDDLRIWTPHLKIPHPRMSMRRFILLPAADVAAEWVDPVTELSIDDLFRRIESGPASLALAADPDPAVTRMLEAASRQAMANWIPQDTLATSDVASPKTQRPSDTQRWITRVDRSPLSWQRPPSLVVFLAEKSKDAEVAWEDHHRELAIQLRLQAPTEPHCEALAIDGPRYLLPAADHAWAVHELVAAFDAIDCPVEPF